MSLEDVSGRPWRPHLAECFQFSLGDRTRLGFHLGGQLKSRLKAHCLHVQDLVDPRGHGRRKRGRRRARQPMLDHGGTLIHESILADQGVGATS